MSGSASITISVVICTKDRPRELERCVASVLGQTRPPSDLVVVDASARPDAGWVDAVHRALPRCRVSLLFARPGLPAQRNVGTRAAVGSVVVFLDDDVVLEPEYLAEIGRVYADDTTGRIGGVGGAQVPDPTPREGRVRRLAARLFLLEGYGRGIVKRSGSPEYVLSPTTPMEVEFLSGCNMSYRRDVLQEYAFDERLSGYALGEDLQFSYRVSRRWRLLVTPRARLAHRHASNGRPPSATFRAMSIFNRYLFFREEVARRPLDWVAYGWAAFGDLLTRLRAPRERALHGLARGYGLVLRHALRGALPAEQRSREPQCPG